MNRPFALIACFGWLAACAPPKEKVSVPSPIAVATTTTTAEEDTILWDDGKTLHVTKSSDAPACPSR